MRTKLRLFLCVLGTFVFMGTFAQPPLVYTVENSGTSFAAPPLPTLANCPTIQYLPDPFKWADGSGNSSAFSDWEHHRNDFRAMIENYEIGTKPVVDKASQVTATYSGGSLKVTVTANGQSMTLTCAVSIPSGATAPYPVCIGMNSSYGSVTSSDFTSRGIVGITFSHDQVTTYNGPANTDPFFKLYPSQNIDNTGQYAAWAWGVSRIIDGLEKVKAAGTLNVDLSHICVTGCSYAGKMALFSGAFDERVALTIAQESGGGGATSWRYSNTESTGSVEGLAQTDNRWFKNSMFDFGGANVTKLPDDHHMLTAMCAPRALYCTGNTDYTWLSNPSCYVNCMATNKIYTALGIADRFGFNVDGGHSHCTFPSDQESEVQYFLNRFMKGQTSLSQTITTHPSSYSSIDYAVWTSNWGGTTNVPVTGVSVSPTTVSIGTGGTSQLTATVAPANATNKSVSWSSSSTSIATVSSTGLVTGVAGGSATITVTTVDGAKTATSAVTVTTSNVPVTGVSVSPATLSISTGATSQLSATISPSNATNKSVSWSSGNTAVATVSSTGLVTGVANGSATITVTTADGAFTATSAVTVTQGSGNTVNINAGGAATGSFTADQYSSGGSTYTNTATIDLSQITSNVPPAAIFNSERYGTFSYTIPSRTAGSAQTVTLYFAETYVTAAGQRVFNVSINGTSVLSNFDIYSSAGGQNKAIARTFSTTANSSGQVVISFSAVTQSPKVNGISVSGGGAVNTLSVSTTSLNVAAAANSTGTFSITSNVSWTVSSNQTWLTASPVSGSNNGTVTVTAQQNTGTATRSATVTVSATGVTSQSITVTQTAATTITLSVAPSTLTVAAAANSTGTFNVTSNTSWTVSSSQTWLTVSPAAGSNNGTATVTAQQNTGSTTRSATVTVSATGATSQTVSVTQSGTGSSSVNINCGGSATGSFSADQYFSGGTSYTNTATINMSLITSNVPPTAIFNSERYGAMTYTIPNLTAGSAQTVTLYFAETYLTASGQRVFNVSINGTAVLTNFDIYASAAGQNKAIAQTFSTTANSSGQVVIQFTTVTQSPKINGITVTAGTAKSAFVVDNVNSNAKTNSVLVYPNPVSGILNVSLTGLHTAISLVNSNGQEVLKMNTEQTNVTIDMAKYLSGIYFLKISGSNQTIIKKIVKQ